MKIEDALSQAVNLAAWLTESLHDLPVPATLRSQVAGACFAIALDHQQAVVALLQRPHPLCSSAFALVRPTFEAHIRGMWFFLCASDEQLDAFAKGGKPPDMASLVSAVEKRSEIRDGLLSDIYKNNWNALSAYTHTGSHQVQRWNKSNAIEPNYDDQEVVEVLRFTGTLALLSGLSMARMADNPPLSELLLERVRRYAKNAP